LRPTGSNLTILTCKGYSYEKARAGFWGHALDSINQKLDRTDLSSSLVHAHFVPELLELAPPMPTLPSARPSRFGASSSNVICAAGIR
jgi:hypothetical protein